MYKTILLLGLVGVFCTQENSDQNSIMEYIFGKPPMNIPATLSSVPKPATIVPSISQPRDSKVHPCTTLGGNGGCVRYFNGDNNNTAIDGDGIIDKNVPDNKRNSYQDVCCNIPGVRKPDNIITSRPDTSKQFLMAEENGDLDSITESFFGKAFLNNVQKPSTIIPPLSQPQNSEDQPCTTHDGKEGRCMHYFFCDTNNTVIDGDKIIDMSVQANKCNSYQYVCCNIPDVSKPENPITPGPDTTKQVVMVHDNGNTVSLIEFIFGKPPMPTRATLNNAQKPATIIPPVSQHQDLEDQPCTTHDGKEGRCMHYSLCDTNDTVIDGEGIVNMSVQANKCNAYQEVCCNIPDVMKPNNTITPRPDTFKQIGKGPENRDLYSIIESLFGRPPKPSRVTLTDAEIPATTVPPIPQPQNSEDQPCTTRDGKEGRCMHYILCNNNNTGIDGDGIINMSVQANKCNAYQDVCCNIPDGMKPNNTITPRPDTSKQIGTAQEKRDPDSIIDFIFGKPPMTSSLNNVQNPDTTVPPLPQPQDSEDQPCTTRDGKEGRCMHYFLCDNNNPGIDGDEIINMSVQANKCNSYQDVCCNIPDVSKPDNTITPRPDTSNQIGTAQENGDPDSIIDFIFGKPPMPTSLNNVQNPDTTVPPLPQPQDSEDQPCTTHDGKEGRCMHYFLCDNNNPGSDGDGIINMSVQANKCNSYQDVCCNIPDVMKPNNTITPRPDTFKQIGTAQENGDPDSIIDFIFGKPPMPTPLNNVPNPDTTVPPLPQPQDSEDQPCTTSDGKEGRCVPYFLCDNNNLGIDGDGIINKSVQANKCNSYQDVCCNIPDVMKPENTITPRPDTSKHIGTAQENRDPDSIIDFIFGKPPMTTSLNNVQNPDTAVPPLPRPQDSEDQPCTTRDGKEGRCMHYFLCDNNNPGIDGDGIINMSVQAIKCNSYQNICCNIPEVSKSENPITPPPDISKQIGMQHENDDLDSIIDFIFGQAVMHTRASLNTE